MCCVFLILVFLGPRAGILIWWLADQARWNAMFENFIWPALGFVFVPWTTLMYVVVEPAGASWLRLGLAWHRLRWRTSACMSAAPTSVKQVPGYNQYVSKSGQ